jgi:hypothetical protein
MFFISNSEQKLENFSKLTYPILQYIPHVEFPFEAEFQKENLFISRKSGQHTLTTKYLPTIEVGSLGPDQCISVLLTHGGFRGGNQRYCRC